MYEYKAIVTRVIDGDTFVADVDLGFNIWAHKQVIRMDGINCKELATAEGVLAKNRLIELIENKVVLIKTKKDKKEKYGRWLGTVLLEENNTVTDINEKMIVEKMAVKF